ncbi:MAG: LamG-like jellyroll fold domain-containing protein [Verrucomicrobiales bacterium]
MGAARRRRWHEYVLQLRQSWSLRSCWSLGGPDIGWADSGGAPAAEWHLLTYSYDGTTTRVYSDGVLQNSEVLGAGVINTHAGFPINVGAQNTGSGIEPSLQLSGYVGQVRVHSDVLSDAQILTNYNQEVGNYVFGGALPGLFGPDDKPVHRWSFDNVAGAAPDGTVVIDLIGGANGLVRGTGALATGTGIDLPGAPNSVGSGGTYIDLPNGLISSKTQVTLEGWVSIDGNTNWPRIFDIGSSEGGEITGPGDTNGGGGSGLDYLMPYHERTQF